MIRGFHASGQRRGGRRAKLRQVAAVIDQNGQAAREFIVIAGALVSDLGWVSMKKSGMVKAYPRA